MDNKIINVDQKNLPLFCPTQKENLFSLSSVILKEKYGYLYNYYLNYLQEEKIIKLERNYLKGSNARVYSLMDSVLSNKINR